MTYLWAFVVGGLICVAGQLLIDLTSITPARVLVTYVVAGVVLSALGLLGVKVVPYHFGFPAIAYGYAVVLGVALVGAVVVFRVMQAAGGKLRLKGNWVEVLPKSANYALLYVTCGVVAAVVIAALLLGGLAVLYGVLVAWLLILAVYYTVRLM